jgi:hypothetical protein
MLQNAPKMHSLPRASEAQENQMPLFADWKPATRGTSLRRVFSILKDGVEDALVEELVGCTSTQGMEGVCWHPLNKKDGKADWGKSVVHSALVPMNNDGVLFQVMVRLAVDYPDRKTGSKLQTDRRCVPSRSCVLRGVVFKAAPLEALACGNHWHYEAWNPMFEMAPSAKWKRNVASRESLSSSSTSAVSAAAAAPTRLDLPDPIRVEEVPIPTPTGGQTPASSAACADASP